MKKMCFGNLDRTVTVTTRTGRNVLLPLKLLFVRLIVNEKKFKQKMRKISHQGNEGYWQVLRTTTSTVFMLYNI